MPPDAPAAGTSGRGRLLLTAFGLGRAPLMPGTVASLPVAAIVGLAAGCAPGASGLCLLMVLYGVVVTLRFGGGAEDPDGHGDPPWVVSDEVAGQAIACLGTLPFGFSWPAVLAAFVLFRLFDIVKPWPVGALERLPGAVGVLMDDVAAGALAAGAVLGGGSLEAFTLS